MPRDSDGKLRRDGSNAACVQQQHPVDERGRLHGALDLELAAERRIVETDRVVFSVVERRRRWRKRRQPTARLRLQDKSRKVLGGRTDQKAKENNLLAKGALAAITLLHSAFHWEHWNLATLRVVSL